jgi:hypothetical protein
MSFYSLLLKKCVIFQGGGAQWDCRYGGLDCRCAILASGLTQTAIHAIIKSCPLPTSVFVVLDCGTPEPCISASCLQGPDQLLAGQFLIIH